MRDVIGEELKVGDLVVKHTGNRNGSSFLQARVVGFTPKMVRLQKPSGSAIYVSASHTVAKTFNQDRIKEDGKTK